MDPITKVVEDLVHQNTTTSKSDGEVCEDCGKHIPPLKLEILGKERWVQPVCECYQKKKLNELADFQNYQRKQDVRKLFSISDIGERYTTSSFQQYAPRPGSENGICRQKKLRNFY